MIQRLILCVFALHLGMVGFLEAAPPALNSNIYIKTSFGIGMSQGEMIEKRFEKIYSDMIATAVEHEGEGELIVYDSMAAFVAMEAGYQFANGINAGLSYMAGPPHVWDMDLKIVDPVLSVGLNEQAKIKYNNSVVALSLGYKMPVNKKILIGGSFSYGMISVDGSNRLAANGNLIFPELEVLFVFGEYVTLDLGLGYGMFNYTSLEVAGHSVEGYESENDNSVMARAALSFYLYPVFAK